MGFYDIYLSQRQLEHTFLKFYSQTSEVTTYSYLDFFRKVESFYFHLEKMNIKALDKAIVIINNDDTSMIVYWALLLKKVTIIPINYLENKDYIEKIQQHSEAHHILDSKIKKDIVLEKGQNIIQMTDISTEYPAVIFYTSGTTGNSKGVCLSERNLLANSRSTTEHFNLTSTLIHYSCLPLHHVNAFNFSFLTTCFNSGTLIYQQSFSPISFWEIIKQNKVNIISSVPRIIKLLNNLNLPFSKNQYPELKYVVSASAPLTSEDLIKFKNKYNINIYQGYGLSEAVNFSIVTSPFITDEEYKEVTTSSNLISIGCAIYGNKIELLDNDSIIEKELEVGEIIIQGDNLMMGYLNNEQETQKSLWNGYLRTGDLGFFKIINKKKYYYISGRLKEIIKRNGELAYINEIEEELAKYFKDRNFCVVPFPNSYTSEEIGLVVEDYIEADREDLKLFLMTNFPLHRRSKVILYNKIIRTSTFKPKRKEMLMYFSDYSEKNIGNNVVYFHEC